MGEKRISWDILLRSACGALSDDEEAIFQAWLKEDLRHQDYYGRVCRIWSSGEASCDLDTDISKMIEGFQGYVREEKRLKHRKFIRNLYRYAACFLVVLGLGGGVFFFYKGSFQADTSHWQERQLLKGGGKAIVLLADGVGVDVDFLADTSLYKVKGVEIQKDSGIIKYRGQEESAVAYNTIMIPRGGEYRVELSDGSIVWLNSEAQLKIPTFFIGNERRVFLSGEAYFVVAKNEKMPFIVETDLGDVKVYGTEFNVKRYKEEKQLKATLVEGSIGFSSDRIAELKLKPGFQLSLNDGSTKPKIKQVKVYNEIAWRNKQFCFENEPLGEIIRNLERWYDVKFLFADPELRKLEFSGTLNRYDKIETLLHFFEEGVNVRFSVEEGIVRVTKR